MPKTKKQPLSEPMGKPQQILLDESFLLCASGFDCDSKGNICQDDLAEDREFNALEALLAAYHAKISLVIDDGQPSQVREFYHRYLEMSYKHGRGRSQIFTAAKILAKWLGGRGGITKRKPAKLNHKAIEKCNLKPDTLDPLLCQLAIACHGDAPIWTLDSDFWCAREFHEEIKPVCPQKALDSVR